MSPSSQWFLFPWHLPLVLNGSSRSHDYPTPPLSPFERSKKGQLTWAGPSGFSSEIFRIGVEKQVCCLGWVKQTGEPRSSEAATFYVKTWERESAVSRKRSRDESWREPQAFWVSVWILPKAPLLWTEQPGSLRYRTLLFCWLDLASVTCTKRTLNNTNEISVCNWSFTDYVSSLREYWPFQKSQDERYNTYKLF